MLFRSVSQSRYGVAPAALKFNINDLITESDPVWIEAAYKSGLVINWLLSGVAKSATSSVNAQFTGDATGTINYANGDVNTEFKRAVIYSFG